MELGFRGRDARGGATSEQLAEFLETIPRGTFKARCLGKMTDWVTESGEVTLEAIAIFR